MYFAFRGDLIESLSAILRYLSEHHETNSPLL